MHDPLRRAWDVEPPPGKMGHGPFEPKGRAACSILVVVLFLAFAGWVSWARRAALYEDGRRIAEERILKTLRDEVFAERKAIRHKVLHEKMPQPKTLPEPPERVELLAFEPEALGPGWLLVGGGRRRSRPIEVTVTVRGKDGAPREFRFTFVCEYGAWKLRD
ncbi:MAG: hypothetical protein AB7N76_29920 [Planctomycetota bacterium]